MKKQALFPVLLCFLLFSVQALFGQTPTNAVHLGSGGKVTNSIIYGNFGQYSISSETPIIYSTSDSAIVGAGNIPHLQNSPFDENFRIFSGSPAYNAGTIAGLRSSDTLDLDYNPRVNCTDIDMGAFEHSVIATQIIQQPVGKTICEGTSFSLTVEAAGTGLSYQWQKNGENIGRSSVDPRLFCNGFMSDTGTYRVMVQGLCGDLISDAVRIHVSAKPSVVPMNDTVIVSGGSVTLYVQSSVGDVNWFKEDYVTPVEIPSVLNPTVTPITQTTQFIAVATNGVCLDRVEVPVNVIVNGLLCEISLRTSDTLVCYKDPYQILPAFEHSTTTITNWFIAGTAVSYANGQVIFPEQDIRLVAVGFSYDETTGAKQTCYSDTLQIRVYANIPTDTFEIIVEAGAGCFPGDGWAKVVNIIGEENSPYVIEWSNGPTTALNEDLNTGLYTVSVTSMNGTGRTLTETVTVPERSPIVITEGPVTHPNNEACDGGSIFVNVSGGSGQYDFWWDNGSVGQNLLHVEAGVYTLIVTDVKEGCRDSLEIPLSCAFNQMMATLYISPNDDNKNDYLAIKYIEHYPTNQVIILSSSGEEVSRIINYDNNDPNRRWNGRNKRNQILPDGVYYYVVEIVGAKSMAGWILMKASKSK
jgi:gliding motility-associated-like protein